MASIVKRGKSYSVVYYNSTGENRSNFNCNRVYASWGRNWRLAVGKDLPR